MDKIQSLRLSTMLGAFLIGFWLPIRMIGFIPPVFLEVTFDILISVVSLISIYLHFVDSGDNPKRIRSWIRLSVIVDLICVVPFSLFVLVYANETYESLLLLNLLAARHIRQIKPYLDQFDSLQPITYRLVPLIIFLPLLVHLVSCGWMALGSGTAGIDDDKWLMYVKSIYWSFTTLTTVGYGDISAKTIPQMFYACFTQVLGVGVFGFIISNVAGLLARSDAAREHHMDNLDKIETFMKLHKIPNDLRLKIRTYYHYVWLNKKGYQENSLIDDLPKKIQSELFLHINKSIISKVPFLREANPEMVSELMSQLKSRIFVPDEKIFKVDEPGDALYFIQNGTVDVILKTGETIATLQEGAFFGEMALVSDRPRTATAKANTFCDVYMLEKHAFDKVTEAYPEFKKHLENIMANRKAA